MASSGNYSSSSSSCVSNSQGGAKRKGSQPQFSKDEEDLILRMYKLVGNRWSLIAGRIPGRSAEEIKKYCKSPNFMANLGQRDDSAFSGDSENCANNSQH